MERTGRGRAGIDWGLFALLALGALAILIARRWLGAETGPLLADTDDAMRMVVVRDLLAGQGWHDLVQHRLNTPYGAEIHWSRLIDLPLAAMIAALAPFIGSAAAETVAAHLWPLGLFLVLLWISARLCVRLVGPAGLLPGLVLPVLSPAVVAEFAPGRIDHHNVQIVLTLALVWTTIESIERPRFAPIAGVLSATALAIGTEALPAIGAAVLAFGLAWVARAERGDRLAGFGLGLAGAGLVHLAIALPPSRWLEPACDALSASYAAGALLTAAGFVLLALLGQRIAPKAGRFALGLGTGLTVLWVLHLLFPQCFAGPYAGLDPWLADFWIEAIAEAKPWWRSLSDLPGYTLAVGLPVVAGLGIIAWRAGRARTDRAQWLVLGLFVLALGLVMAFQVRGARLAAMPVVPAAAWFVAYALRRTARGAGPPAILAFILGVAVLAGTPVMIAIDALAARDGGHAQEVAETRAARAQCLMPSAFTALAAMPPGRVLAPIDLGPHLLLETPHAVVGAPYHRNQDGVNDTFTALNAPLSAAYAIFDARGIDLVVTCPAMAEMAGLPEAAPDSLVRLLAAGTPPARLVPVGPPGPLALYAVLASGEER